VHGDALYLSGVDVVVTAGHGASEELPVNHGFSVRQVSEWFGG
jgi:hypothetical protein